MRYFCGVVSLFAVWAAAPSTGYVEHPGPRVVPTAGAAWPKPQRQISLPEVLSIKTNDFNFVIVNASCTLLEDALLRYRRVIDQIGGRRRHVPHRHQKEHGRLSNDIQLRQLNVNLEGPCEMWPHLKMNEEYVLDVNSPDVPYRTAYLTSISIWGIMRGLETFSQLLYSKGSPGNLYINSTTILDYPRFPHRGLLLDTGRHYITVQNILKILDGMEMNKLNVFHWHIVDDQSFPFVSVKYPNLSAQAAFHPKLVYQPSDVKLIIDYARVRGIRVMPEFDTPGHTRSWGVAHLELLTACYDNKIPDGNYGPMNPANKDVYVFMQNLLEEVVSVFPDAYVHLGGDEVDFDCWISNPEITKFMKKNNIPNYYKLEDMFIKNIVDMVDKLDSKSIVWEEVHTNGVSLPNNTMVHVWKPDWSTKISSVTSDGLQALLSSCWYLDHLDKGWKEFYECDPHDFPGTTAQQKLVKGGEACMWAEMIDDSNVVSRIFPRASATAERLWSNIIVNNKLEAAHRLEEHYCRMNKRGVNAQPPNGPGFCV